MFLTIFAVSFVSYGQSESSRLIMTKICLLCVFSGGPLIEQSDGSLLGITSFGDVEPGVVSRGYSLQVFTSVHVYFDWIQAGTGLEMPKCAE